MSKEHEDVKASESPNAAETSANKQSESNNMSDDSSTINEVDELERLKSELEEIQQKYLYLLSEFENFKRRNARERIDLFKTASKDLMLELLPVMDDFERGLQAMEVAQDVSAVKTGVELVYNKFKHVLTNKGLQAIESVGADFDTELHEAISQAAVADEAAKNKIVAEVEKGYRLNDQVIRYAKVIVGV
ncbi:MAG: nucleotide exchange factor GrpE [Bacteroidia bacterium]